MNQNWSICPRVVLRLRASEPAQSWCNAGRYTQVEKVIDLYINNVSRIWI